MTKVRWHLIVLYCLMVVSHSAAATEFKIAYFTQDPPSVGPLSPSFDPDSYAVIAQIFDTLVYMDLDGHFKPGLATEWQRLSDTRWLFKLRQGVKFHNGEAFNADAVKFTFDYILDPKNRTGNSWIFSSLLKVEKVNNAPFQVIFETKYPDGMFLNRLNLFASICPPKYIQKKGFEFFQKNPVGTGPYRFDSWTSNKQITLKKNSDYWQPGLPNLETLAFVILKQSQWLEAFENKRLDFIPNLSGNRTRELMRRAQGDARIIKRPVLASYFVLLKNQGALSELKVRQALNYAVNKQDIIKFADFGNALPMASLGKKGEFGANPDLVPLKFSLQKAKTLLSQTNVSLPIKLKALVADAAEPAAKIIQRNLLDIQVELELEVVSRSEWTNRVVVHQIKTGKRPDYDLVINFVDNPIWNLAFHAGLFLESTSPWSLLNSQEFDKRFSSALQSIDTLAHEKALQSLDRYIHDNALMLFTTQKVITAAIRKNYDITKFGGNGHLGYEILSKAKVIEK